MSLAPQPPRATGPRSVAPRAAERARASAPALLALTTQRPDLVEVSTGSRVLGFIEAVDHVFVALVGPRYDIALELVQAHDFGHALTALQATVLPAAAPQEGTRDDHR